TVLTPSLFALPSNAIASSRFGFDHASPMGERVHVDFTIIIPEILLIGAGSGTAEDSSSPHDASLNNSGPSHNGPQPRRSGSVLIVVNSGTLAFGPSPHPSRLQLPRKVSPSDQAGNLPVNYLVAMP
ncbi:MAG: hypothetical protein KDI01_09710, partial [Halioglobus sp.]|nr:hypothetical protein [Halioglobus sp.]